jgi:hypothetical protein
MPKVIFITEACCGKSYPASLLAKDYDSKGVSYQVVHVGSQRDASQLVLPSSGYLIVVTNLPVSIENIWQAITVGGDYLPAAD